MRSRRKSFKILAGRGTSQAKGIDKDYDNDKDRDNKKDDDKTIWKTLSRR